MIETALTKVRLSVLTLHNPSHLKPLDTLFDIITNILIPREHWSRSYISNLHQVFDFNGEAVQHNYYGTCFIDQRSGQIYDHAPLINNCRPINLNNSRNWRYSPGHSFWYMNYARMSLTDIISFLALSSLYTAYFHRCYVCMVETWELVYMHWQQGKLQLQPSAVITRSNLSRYYIRHCDNSSRKWIRYLNHSRHPIPRPHGRAMGCLLWGFGKKLTAL